MLQRVAYAIAAALIGVLRFLPLKLSYTAGYAVAHLLDLLIPRLRRIAARNLSVALPSAEHDRIIDGVFRSIGRLLVALARFPSLNKSNIASWISYEGLEHYQAAKQKGRGILIATAHLGNWELSAFAHALMTEPMNVMVRPLDNPYIDRLVENRRTLSGNRLIFKKDGARNVLRALKNNEPTGVLIDQNTTPTEGVFINFFGQQACAGVGFVKLAHHSGAPVIPGFALWNEPTQRYILHFLPEVQMTGDSTVDTQRVNAVLEEVIRRHPDQWMWIHRRWKTRPPGEPSFY